MLHLLKERSFGAMVLTQFLGAFNDNAFKQLVVFLATAAATASVGAQAGGAVGWITEHPWGGGLGNLMSPQALPPLLFALPFVVLGPLTGSLADRLSKITIIKWANFIEILVMVMATLAFALRDYGLLLVTVLMMGSQSALFGPSKYGCIKELVGERELSRANALIQSSTMIAILAGVFLGGVFRDQLGDLLWIGGLWYVGFATLGWIISLRIETLPAVDPHRRLRWNPMAEFISHWKATEGNRHLILAIIASAFFYMMAATFLLVVVAYGVRMQLSATLTSVLTAMSGLGIIVGAWVAGRVSGDRIEGGLIPLGLIGMAGSLLAIQIAPDSVVLVHACLFSMGIFSGLFTIPVRCLVQGLPREERRGSVQGLSEVMDFIGILLASPLFTLFDKVGHLDPGEMFFAGGLLFLGFAALSLVFAGEFFVRLVLLGLTHGLYRLRVSGQRHVPEHGGALLVANHVSFIDAILVAAGSPRQVRYLMHRDYFRVPLVGWFARKMGAIPIAAGDGGRAKLETLELAAEHCAAGELVCIFSEGVITRSGMINPFRRGLERIAEQAGVPLIPVALDRVWGSVFSFRGGRFFWKLPTRIFRSIDVCFGAPLPGDTPAPEVRARVQELIADSRREQSAAGANLAARFLASSRRYARRLALVDSSGRRLTYRRTLISVLDLRRVLRRRLPPDSSVAVLLPPGIGGALANLALTLDGRTVVNLNATLPNPTLKRLLERSGATVVITAQRALTAMGRKSPLDEEHTLDLEQLGSEVTSGDRVRAVLLALLPGAWLAHLAAPRGVERTAVAAVLFSSGTSGEPKGVELTHANILENVASLSEVLELGSGRIVLGVLPHFHSFGYTVTLWAPLLGGARVACHENPRDAKRIGELCGQEGVTVLLATPSLCQSWMRRIPAESFAALEVAICGAEKLSGKLARAWEERYGVPLLEGYGCTECGPVVAFNLPDPPGAGEVQRTAKPGTVGRPLPGIAVRVLDAESGEILPVGSQGLLQVKSAAVMRGYLHDVERTREALGEGWYVTGDVARVDEEGFLVLVDRLARFSKIGGEMVPHCLVEEELTEVVARLAGEGADTPDIAVTAAPDERKGEKLVVVHTPLGIAVDEVLEELSRSDLPALFRPRARDFVEVEEMPRLGSGKRDLGALKEMAIGAPRFR